MLSFFLFGENMFEILEDEPVLARNHFHFSGIMLFKYLFIYEVHLIQTESGEI